MPPTIADDLTDVAVTRLSPAVLTCYASGVPPPAVSWSKDGAQLGSRGGGYRVLPTGRGSGQGTGGQRVPAALLLSPFCLLGALEIRQALPVHTGHYTCTARSAAGTARKHLRLVVHGMCGSGGGSCSLHVAGGMLVAAFLWLAEPPALKPLPGVVMVKVNASTVLSCEASGVPRPEVTWQKDGASIAGGEQEPTLPASPCPGVDWGG